MELGFQVKVCDLPQTHRARVRKEPPEQGVVYRHLWRQPGASSNNFHYLQLREELSEEPLKEAGAIAGLLSDSLTAMAEQVVAVEYSGSGIGLYWRENGSLELVEQMAQQLESLKLLLSKAKQSKAKLDDNWSG